MKLGDRDLRCDDSSACILMIASTHNGKTMQRQQSKVLAVRLRAQFAIVIRGSAHWGNRVLCRETFVMRPSASSHVEESTITGNVSDFFSECPAISDDHRFSYYTAFRTSPAVGRSG